MAPWTYSFFGALYLYVAFWGCVGTATRLQIARLPGMGTGLGYALYWALSCLFFGLALQLGTWVLCLWLIPIVYGSRGLFTRRMFWLGMPLLVLVGLIPISDSDSVGYMIPMADNAITNHTLGTWDTFNLRSIYRLWGVAAQTGNQLLLSQRAIHFVELSSVIAWLAFLQVTYVLARLLNSTKKRSFWAALGLGLAPAVFISLFTVKDDLPFGLLFLLLAGLALAKERSVFAWSLVLFALIGSKLFYPLAIIGLLPLFWGRRECWRPALLGLVCAFAAILLGNGSRIWTTWQIAPEAKYRIGSLLGASPVELGWRPAGISADQLSFEVPKSAQVVHGVPDDAPSQETHGWLDWVGTTLKISLLDPVRLWATAASDRYYQHNSFHYNYSNFGWWAGLMALGLIGYRAGAPWWAAILSLGVLALAMPYPSFNHYRYMFGPLVLLALLGLRLVPPRFLRPLAVILALALLPFYLAFVHLPAITRPIRFLFLYHKVPYALSVTTLNPVLGWSNPDNIGFQRDQGDKIVVAPFFPGFSPQYLFTDQSSGPIIETYALPASLTAVIEREQPTYVVVSSHWNVHRSNLSENALAFLGHLQYVKLGGLVSDEVLIYQRK